LSGSNLDIGTLSGFAVAKVRTIMRLVHDCYEKERVKNWFKEGERIKLKKRTIPYCYCWERKKRVDKTFQKSEFKVLPSIKKC